MTDKHITVDTLRWRSALPWLQLLRAANLALRMRVLLVALLAVLVFSAGQAAIQRLPFATSLGVSESILQVDLRAAWHGDQESRRFEPIQVKAPAERLMIWSGYPALLSPEWLAWPLETVHAAARDLFQAGANWSQVAVSVTRLLWALLVWAVFGGALGRMNSVRFARDEGVSPRSALQFSVRNWQSFVYAPLLPLVAVGFCLAVIYGVGRLEYWTGTGWVIGMLGWIPMFSGFAAAALLILTTLSWPLMVAAISTEGSDGFDGLSRAFGYVMNRPWYLAWLIALSCGVGQVATFFVWWFFDVAAWLVTWNLALPWPQSPFWDEVQLALRYAFLASYFWAATTVIYFLLRQSDDGTPLDQVYTPGPPPKAEPLPVVGVAASQQPVIERPASAPSNSGA